jgi:cytochrome c oxidase subunit 2
MKYLLFLIIGVPVFLAGCNSPTTNRVQAGTTWAVGSFDSNGERIYFTATSERETPITYTGGPAQGMMMMGGNLACVSCHGTDARGGRHNMHMETMDAPDIRWSTLSNMDHEKGEEINNPQNQHMEYDFEAFKNSVENGRHPDGDKLKTDMPRWKMSDADLKDIMNYLESLK